MEKGRLKTKIFLDSGDFEETKIALDALGFLDGQTTNPSLVAKNPKIQEELKQGTFDEARLLSEYKNIVTNIRSLLPEGSISIEVYADNDTPTEKILIQAREMNMWISKPHIKLPTNKNGLEAAKILANEAMQLNLTLCFTQQQAAAVYSATKGAEVGQVFVSPFVGRLDDLGFDGMDLIKNINQMFDKSDHHTQLLTASIRSLKQLLYALYLEVDIVTVPFGILMEWAENGLPLLQENSEAISLDSKIYLGTQNLKPIPYEELDLDKDFNQFNLQHELTTAGLLKFSQDWNKLLGKND